MNIIHVCMNVSDADEIADWYVENLDFERTWEFTTPDGETDNVYVAGGNGIEIQLSDTDGDDDFESGDAWDHLAVSVEDTDAAFDRIDNHGVVQDPADNVEAGARTAFIEDPDGHVVELVGPIED